MSEKSKLQRKANRKKQLTDWVQLQENTEPSSPKSEEWEWSISSSQICLDSSSVIFTPWLNLDILDLFENLGFSNLEWIRALHHHSCVRVVDENLKIAFLRFYDTLWTFLRCSNFSNMLDKVAHLQEVIHDKHWMNTHHSHIKAYFCGHIYSLQSTSQNNIVLFWPT